MKNRCIQSIIKHLGYTMLELLLVLSLVSVMVLAGIRIHRHSEVAAVNQQAASEMQTVIASLMYYEAVEGAWPEDNLSCSEEGTSLTESVFSQYYLPNQLIPSLFRSTYCWQENAKDSSQAVGLLSLDLPVRSTHAASTASAVAALIPHAQAVSDRGSLSLCEDGATMCYIHTELVPTVSSSSASGMSLQGIGRCIPNEGILCEGGNPNPSGKCCLRKDVDGTTYVVQFPACAKGYTLNVVYVPAYTTAATQKTAKGNTETLSPAYIFDSGYMRGRLSTADAHAMLSQRDPESADCRDTDDGHTVCDLSVGVGYLLGAASGVFDMQYPPTDANTYLPGTAGLVYVAACQKEET